METEKKIERRGGKRAGAGRPVTGEPRVTTSSISMTPDEWARLEKAAVRFEVTRSRVVRDLIDDHL